MSTIYDRLNKLKSVQQQEDSLLPAVEQPQTESVPSTSEHRSQPAKESDRLASLNELNDKLEGANAALALVDDIVLKKYLSKLSDMSVASLGTEWNVKDALKDVILFKVNKMAYEKDEYATDKFNSIISALTYVSGEVFMIIDGHETKTDFYLGVKIDSESDRTVSSYAKTLKRALLGQFPGAKIQDLSLNDGDREFSEQEIFVKRMSEEANAISICSCIPAMKNSKGEYTNATFIQGIEKFALAMQGQRYTAIILATNVSDNTISNIRQGYENIYTQLSAAGTQQLAYSTNESLSNALTRSKGISDSVGHTESESHTHTTSKSTTETKTESTTHTKGESKDNFWGKAGKLAEPLLEAGAILTATVVGAPIGAVMMGAGAVAGIGGVIGAKQLSESEAKTVGSSTGTTEGTSDSQNRGHSDSNTHTESFTETNGQTSTIGNTKNFTLTIQDKHIQEIQKKIEQQLERMAISESAGLWATAAYFMSYGTDRETSEIGAAIYRSIVQGEQSGVEQSAVSTWYSNNPEFNLLKQYICGLSHPVFSYRKNEAFNPIMLSPTNMLSSKEVAIALALPRKSVPGFPVVEHVSLGKDVVRLDEFEQKSSFDLGCIFDQGISRPNNRVNLDIDSLTQHTFVTGSTGCGKSETVYKLLDSIQKADVKFLIIEPAKGEYKNVFGTEYIFGTNPLISNLLKINPFKFPDGVHVLEHADRLIEIFNVCWPMYAAMPAVLKEAVLNAYEDCGWDLVKSVNKYSNNIFPTFSDLIWELEAVIELSQYSEEVKSNYKGSLVTRVKSLANGINGEIFSGQEIGDEILFDNNVIVDISRIGSQETKSLIMGILIMRLNQYRSNSGIQANSSLRHITVLEEAHNLLKRCSQEQSSEGSNLAGKSVEMISNSIAEMRTYGEGFIIVDQSPSAVDISAIRNTNTKIIMRLPEETDRKTAGKSAAMKDNQIDEIAKLPTGVAVVYQNNWEEPVLCKVDRMSKDKRLRYEFNEISEPLLDVDKLAVEILKFMFKKKMSTPLSFDLDFIKQNLSLSNLPTYVKINVLEAIQEYENKNSVSLWNDDEFVKFSWIISGIVGQKQQVTKLANTSANFDELTKALKVLIHDKVKELPEELDMPILQSLMRDYSTVNENHLMRYSEWLKIARERMYK
ncbi:MAG: ATP-binding protein [Bacteroides sp.]|nr:ATP-binding protein [Bacteroides sp.]